VWVGRWLGGTAGVERVVVEALPDEDGVGEAEVDCQRCDGGHETGPEGAGEVRDIADLLTSSASV